MSLAKNANCEIWFFPLVVGAYDFDSILPITPHTGYDLPTVTNGHRDMKLALAVLGLLMCSVAHADLNSAAKNLSDCVTLYADSQIKTTKSAGIITDEAFDRCSAEVSEYHDSIGPDKAQWSGLGSQQKEAITKIRDQTTAKVRESLSSQIVTFITESRKSS